MSQDPSSSPTTSLQHLSTKLSLDQESCERCVREEDTSDLAPHHCFSSGSRGGDSSSGCGTEVTFAHSMFMIKCFVTCLFRCEVYEPLPAILSNDAPQNSDEWLDEGPPLPLRRWIEVVQRGLNRFQRTGETYSVRATGLSELSHDDLTTVC